MQSNNVLIIDDPQGHSFPAAAQRELAAANVQAFHKTPRLSKIQRKLMGIREFFRGMQAKQIAEAQRIYQNFIKPKFQWTRPDPHRAQRRQWAREYSRYPDPVPPGKQPQAMARRRRQMQRSPRAVFA